MFLLLCEQTLHAFACASIVQISFEKLSCRRCMDILCSDVSRAGKKKRVREILRAKNSKS